MECQLSKHEITAWLVTALSVTGGTKIVFRNLLAQNTMRLEPEYRPLVQGAATPSFEHAPNLALPQVATSQIRLIPA